MEDQVHGREERILIVYDAGNERFVAQVDGGDEFHEGVGGTIAEALGRLLLGFGALRAIQKPFRPLPHVTVTPPDSACWVLEVAREEDPWEVPPDESGSVGYASGGE
jgi:hypothetical protein